MTEAPVFRGLVAGTPILTPNGPVAAEALRPGMLVIAVSGAAAPFRPVAAVRRGLLPRPAIRIRADALDDGTPQEDLLLPPGQALLLDGALIAAADLVDGHGILAEPDGPPLPLVEIVLDGHDAILAAGAAVETSPAGPDSPACAPRRAPDAPLRAALAWRAERMGWAAACDPSPPAEPGSLDERLTSSAFARLGLDLPPRHEG